jgi:hypothetical protein
MAEGLQLAQRQIQRWSHAKSDLSFEVGELEQALLVEYHPL